MMTLVRSLLLLFCLPALVQAQSFVYEREGLGLFVFDMPNDWFVDTDFLDEARAAGTADSGPPKIQIVEAMPMDGSKLWIGFWVVPNVSTLAEGLEYTRSLDQTLLKEVVATTPEARRLGGMPAKTFSGTAVRDSESVEFAVALFEPKPELIAVALYIGRPQTWFRHAEQLEQIRDSLQPLAD